MSHHEGLFHESQLIGCTVQDWMRDPWCPLCAGMTILTDDTHGRVRCMDCAQHIATETTNQLLARRAQHLKDRGL